MQKKDLKVGYCPDHSETFLEEITPPQYRCSFTASCPSVFVNNDNKTYVIIGKAYKFGAEALQARVGADEMAIEISADLLEHALRQFCNK
jgi:hypothetical protein